MDNPLTTILLEKHDGDADAAARYADSRAGNESGILAALYLDAALRLRIRAEGQVWSLAHPELPGRLDPGGLSSDY